MSDYRDVAGRCPACGGRWLFLSARGFVTCSWAECPDPGAAHALLDSKPDPLTPAERKLVEKLEVELTKLR